MNDYVLVVDDEEVNRKLLVKILEAEYEVETASDGKQALQMLKAQPHKYAAIVLDLVMPDMNGFSFLEEYCSDAILQNIPVIVSTGDDNIECETHSLVPGISSASRTMSESFIFDCTMRSREVVHRFCVSYSMLRLLIR